MKRIIQLLIALVIFLGVSVTAHATLIVRGTDTLGNQLIYDTDLDITWYDFTHAYNPWNNQVAWADALTVDFGGTIYDDWRLPTALNQDGTGPCSGYDCTDSEMGHLYYTELGNSAGVPFSPGFVDGLTGLSESFLNLQAFFYWSGTEYAPSPFNAWDFHFYGGHQGDAIRTNVYHALAVRGGDVSIAVPEPGTLLLLGTGLAGMALYRRRFVKR